MTMYFKEIANLIEALTGFTKGGKLQVGHLTQSAPDRWVLIQESGGPTYFTPNEDMVDMMIQVLCHADTYFKAHDDAWAVYKALHGQSSQQMARVDGSGEDYLAMTVEAVYAPQYLGQDSDKKHIFSTNYIFRVEEGGCGS